MDMLRLPKLPTWSDRPSHYPISLIHEMVAFPINEFRCQLQTPITTAMQFSGSARYFKSTANISAHKPLNHYPTHGPYETIDRQWYQTAAPTQISMFTFRRINWQIKIRITGLGRALPLILRLLPLNHYGTRCSLASPGFVVSKICGSLASFTSQIDTVR